MEGLTEVRAWRGCCLGLIRSCLCHQGLAPWQSVQLQIMFRFLLPLHCHWHLW